MTSTTCSKWAFNLALAASLVFLAGAADKAHSKSGNSDKGGSKKFKGLDRNNDGRISRDEWRGSDQSFSVHDCKKLFIVFIE